jgi:hypothetical protein
MQFVSVMHLLLKLYEKQRNLSAICLVIQKMGVLTNKIEMIQVRFMQLVGIATWQEQVIIPNLKLFGENSGVKQIPTDSISVSGGLPGDTHIHIVCIDDIVSRRVFGSSLTARMGVSVGRLPQEVVVEEF